MEKIAVITLKQRFLQHLQVDCDLSNIWINHHVFNMYEFQLKATISRR